MHEDLRHKMHQILLVHGNKINFDINFALRECACNGDLDVVQLLPDHGAEVILGLYIIKFTLTSLSLMSVCLHFSSFLEI
jgi:hypothetical protein